MAFIRYKIIAVLSPLPCIAFVLLAAAAARSQFVTPEFVDWEKIRAAQPDKLSLIIDVPKTRYHQGEIIDTTLTFRNDSTQPYHLWTGTYDRSGRIPNIAIHASDAAGRPVADPLRWYFERGGVGGGLGNDQDLSEWAITFPANQWLRFEKPGTYALRAYSDRVQKGDRFERPNGQDDRVALVSDPVFVTITALNPAEAQRIIDQAVPQLPGDGREADEGAATLRYLGLPESRAALLPFIASGPHSFSATMALYAAPDPVAEARNILAALRAGKIKFNPGLTQIYATLKTAAFEFKPIPESREEREALGRKFRDAFQAASEEITAAATAATGGKGEDSYQTMMTLLFEDPIKRPQVRAELVKVQLDLTLEQGETLLRSWRSFGGEAFLPLVRKMVGPPFHNPDALAALAELKPDEARPLIIDDLQRRSPRFLIPKAVSQIANAPLLTLAAEPVPELEAYFRAQLRERSPKNLDLLMAAVARYGTPDLLPDVVAFYAPKEGKWACSIQADALTFWLRFDPPAGLAALQRTLAAREHTRCYTDVLSEVLLDGWDPAALPIVTAALDDPDPEVVVSAVTVLEAHADVAHLGPSISALRRLSDGATAQNLPLHYAAKGLVQRLIHSTRWKPNAAQRRQLQEIASSRPG